jgi:thiol-disulfide isomerase/thioredoxin
MGPRVTLFALVALAAACSRSKPPPPDGAETLPVDTAETEPTAATPALHDAEPAARAREVTAASPLPMLSADELIAEIRATGNKGTLVNAWASFCGPCRREIPMLEALSANLRAEGIAVYLVSLDDPADAPKAEAFLRERHVTLKSALVKPPIGAFKQRINPRWPGMLPASFLFDVEGRLRYYFGGEAFEEELVPVLDAFARGQPIEGEAGFQVAPEAKTLN